MRPATNRLASELSTMSKNRDVPDAKTSGGRPPDVLFPNKMSIVPSSFTNTFSGSLNRTAPPESLISANTSCTVPGVKVVGRPLNGIVRDVSCAEAQNTDKTQPMTDSSIHKRHRPRRFLQIFLSTTISSLSSSLTEICQLPPT